MYGPAVPSVETRKGLFVVASVIVYPLLFITSLKQFFRPLLTCCNDFDAPTRE
jgi:hypothetical protein